MPDINSLADWLLDSDPALHWQVERDLLHAPDAVWQATRARVATEGFGARLLALQDADGQWAGGAFFPSGFDFKGPEAQPGAGQPWTATTWSLNLLREWGVDPSALAGTAQKLAANSRWEYDGLPYWGGEVDCCINSWTLSNGLWLGADVSGLPGWFVEHQMAEGGWNCCWVEGSTRSSVESTLNALKGLLDWEAATGGSETVSRAVRAAEEYLLERHLFRRRTTGEPIAERLFLFTYPFRAFYNLLNATEYFRRASQVRGSAPDPRIAEAIEHIRAARQPDGTWLQERTQPGRVWFEVDVPVGEPSKWLTLYAIRVLDWWDGAAGTPDSGQPVLNRHGDGVRPGAGGSHPFRPRNP